MSGIFPVSRHLDHVGPIGRSVADLVYLTAAMASDAKLIDRFLDYLRRGKVPRLAVPDSYFFDQAEDGLAHVTRQAIDRLSAGCAPITEIRLPDTFAEIPLMHRRIMAVDTADVHARWFARHRDRYGPQLTQLIEHGQGISREIYRESLEHQALMCDTIDALLNEVDGLLTPATPTTAPATLTTTGDPVFNLPWSYCGAPTVSIPCGTADDGMPVALQIVGRRHGDPHLLAVAQWCEQRLAETVEPARL